MKVFSNLYADEITMTQPRVTDSAFAKLSFYLAKDFTKRSLVHRVITFEALA
jgi:hypothetical protein